METGDAAKAVPFLKRFTVFNVAQCEGLRPGLAPEPVPLPEREIVPVAESVIAASGVDFRIGGARAFYAPGEDFVAVPPQPAFFHQINYYRTALHELTHATGHPSRLDRKLVNAFGSKDYAREELVAEMALAVPNSAASACARSPRSGFRSVSASSATCVLRVPCRCRSGPTPRVAPGRSSRRNPSSGASSPR